ncbi:ThiF family adenylyltransferase [Chryseobacterium aquaticum]|uniref:ThiF family adenylyltransferase n=1 Tax=Chryseobacterium aquaticum TaxID=452084 RepID=A0A848NBW9_9FLAO|nr:MULTISPECIES: ThiF family adenylyltransferase [Chryseobacterium]NMR34963.1 ThiF family adenylyltransferase [Chryseobacterium aquaticum]NRQ47173.1 ThiF family adenylyltransferase [Chryseobacterium sp. C-204]
MDYSRIEPSVDMGLVRASHIVIVGAGGSYSLATSLARTGIGKLTVLDFDTVEETNIVRQGYNQSDIGHYKVVALGQEIKSINPEIEYSGIPKNFLEMNDEELDAIFSKADLLLFLTDSFKAQAMGNILALRYNKPAIWSGWYEGSRTAELFFQVPDYTTACFRCACSSRYLANEKEEVKASSNSNTIFHSMLLDSFIGMLSLSILHRSKNGFVSPFDLGLRKCNEFEKFWKGMLDKNDQVHYNFFQFKAHPFGGNILFDKAYEHLNGNAQNFISYWQKADAELKVNGYDYDCPDCNGLLHNKIHSNKDNQ